MTARMFAAGLVAVVGFGSVFAPVQTSAGSTEFAGRPAGFGVTGWGGHGAYYDSSNQVFVRDQPAQYGYPVSVPASVTIRVVPAIYDYRLGCQSQTQNIAGGAGERTVTIVRC